MINEIVRDGTKVYLKIDLNLPADETVLIFEMDCCEQRFAELLKNHLRELEKQWKRIIAKGCLCYLEKEEISRLKSRLNKEWNGKDHCWKKQK